MEELEWMFFFFFPNLLQLLIQRNIRVIFIYSVNVDECLGNQMSGYLRESVWREGTAKIIAVAREKAGRGRKEEK